MRLGEERKGKNRQLKNHVHLTGMKGNVSAWSILVAFLQFFKVLQMEFSSSPFYAACFGM